MRSIEPSYSALPTIIPSIPSFSKSDSEIRSAIEPTPPDAITGLMLISVISLKAWTFGPFKVPSVAMSVDIIAANSRSLSCLCN